jgi:hypothetical protein
MTGKTAQHRNVALFNARCSILSFHVPIVHEQEGFRGLVGIRPNLATESVDKLFLGRNRHHSNSS